MTAGLQYNFNRDWGVPYLDRKIKMNEEESEDVVGEMIKVSNRSVVDIRLTAHYSGLSSDMSSGLIFGFKLPSGEYKYFGFDSPDIQIGTGSTDIILGAYHLGKINNLDNLNYFAQGNLQKPLMTARQYRHGAELNFNVGTYYNLEKFATFAKVSPLLQMIVSNKSNDVGFNADVANSGYSRVLFSPGVEIDSQNFKFYADIELPIYNNIKGNELEVEKIFKFIVGYKF